MKEAPLAMLGPTYALIIASIYLGIDTDPMLSAAQEAAEMLWNIGTPQGGA